MTVFLRRIVVTAAIAVLVAAAAIALVRAGAPAESVQLGATIGAVTPSDPAADTGVAAPGAADSGDLALELDAILAAETNAAPADRAGPRGQLRRLAAWGRLVHATVVVDLKKGGLTTVQLDRGTISAVSATSLTIAEAGGGSVTVQLGDETRVRRDGGKAAIAALKTGDAVFVMSKVEAGGTGAYLVVVPRR